MNFNKYLEENTSNLSKLFFKFKNTFLLILRSQHTVKLEPDWLTTEECPSAIQCLVSMHWGSKSWVQSPVAAKHAHKHPPPPQCNYRWNHSCALMQKPSIRVVRMDQRVKELVAKSDDLSLILRSCKGEVKTCSSSCPLNPTHVLCDPPLDTHTHTKIKKYNKIILNPW